MSDNQDKILTDWFYANAGRSGAWAMIALDELRTLVDQVLEMECSDEYKFERGRDEPRD